MAAPGWWRASWLSGARKWVRPKFATRRRRRLPPGSGPLEEIGWLISLAVLLQVIERFRDSTFVIKSIHLIDFISIRDISTQPSICLSRRNFAKPYLFKAIESSLPPSRYPSVRRELHFRERKLLRAERKASPFTSPSSLAAAATARPQLGILWVRRGGPFRTLGRFEKSF